MLKLKITAGVETSENLEELSKNAKGVLNLPEEAARQPDLSYFVAVLVSSGMNKNGAFFLGSELIEAYNSIGLKPLDIEHAEYDIVGHLCAAAIIDQEGNVKDVEELKKLETAALDDLKLDILVSGVLYKDRFPEAAEDLLSGEYSVSMECYYTHYDVIVGDVIIPSSRAGFLNDTLDKASEFDLVGAGKSYGTITIGRVLRNIIFSGMGLVKNPANSRSIVIEAAAVAAGEEDEKENTEDTATIDLTGILPSIIEGDSVLEYLVHNNFEVAYSSYTGQHSHLIPTDKLETFEDGAHGHCFSKALVPKDVGYIHIFDGGYHKHSFTEGNPKMSTEIEKHTHIVEIYKKDGTTIYKETTPAEVPHRHELSGLERSTYGGAHFHYVECEGKRIKTVYGKRAMKKFLEEKNLDSPGALDFAAKKEGATENAASREVYSCVNFKKYVYDTTSLYSDGHPVFLPSQPGALQNTKLQHTAWCSLFDVACMTLGGDATSPECWRNILNRTTKEVILNDYEQLLENRETYKNLANKLGSAASDVANALAESESDEVKE
jgi:hypothetical protein